MRTCPHAYTRGEPPATTVAEAMSERQFMDYILDQLLTGQRHPLVKLTGEALEAIEAEPIGEHFLRYPFLY